jgi:regulatory protein
MALRMLTRREHSSAELKAKLQEKGCVDEVAGAVVAQLAVERLVSDERFVEALISARRRRGFGPVRIRHELREKGIPAEQIDAALDMSARYWLADLEQLCKRRFGSRPAGNYSERARRARFLQYRGFTTEQIARILSSRADD